MEPESPTEDLKTKYSLFSHQTSGHSCMIKVNNSFDHILKPLGPSEQLFYETTFEKKPKKFLHFIPKYYGIYYPDEIEISFFSSLAKRLIVKKI